MWNYENCVIRKTAFKHLLPVNPLNANDADRRHRIRKRVSANDAFRRHRLARAIRVVFLYLRAPEQNVTLGAHVAVVGPSHSYLIVSSGCTRGAQSTAALCAKFTSSCSTKVAVYISARGCIQSGESQHRPYNSMR